MQNPHRRKSAAKVKADGNIITINGQTFAPGTRTIINLPVPSFYSTQSALNLNVHVINGKRAGPKLFVSAAMHGDELNGVEIIRRLLNHKALQRLRGTLIGIPIVNVFGIMQHARYLPDRRDLNRSFPGSKRGSLAARLAHTFMQQIVKQCTHGIDLHTGSAHRTNLPQIRANLDNPQNKALARVFGVPVMINSKFRDGSLRESASELGIPILLYEAGEALRFDELSIRAGVRGIMACMRHLDMLPVSSRKPAISEPFVAQSTVWERATASGIFRSTVQLGQMVKKGDRLGVITDPANFFEQCEYPVLAEYKGVVVGRSNLPLVNEGDALFHIARLENSGGFEAEFEAFSAHFGVYNQA